MKPPQIDWMAVWMFMALWVGMTMLILIWIWT